MPTGSANRQHPHRKAHLILRVEKIAFLLTLSGVFIVLFGFLFLLMPIAAFLDPQSNANGLSDNRLSTLADSALVGVAVSSFGIFVIKLARDFRRFESWTFGLVRFFAKWSTVGYAFFRDDLDDEEIRKAFNQPEYEYPDMPEYGYKLDEPEADRRARAKRPGGTTRDS